MLSIDTAPPGTTLTATVLTEPSDGSLSLASDGSLVYTPDSGWVGIDSFTYEASDGQVDSAPVTVTIQTELTVSSTNYVAVATGDFNGDGNTDFVAVNQGSNDVAVYYGNGDGTFQQSPTTISVGNGPDAVVVGGFGNGAVDIAVANGTDGTVTILLNNGSGTFTTSQTLTVGSDPVAMTLGDFEGNGRLDLAVVNKGSDTVSVFLNNGSGSFSLDTTLSVGTSPTSVAAADLNGAGYDDLVVANSGDNNISVLLSNGNGTFASAVNYSVGTAPSAVVAADFTGSGIIDVAVANSGSGTVSVLLGSGNGTLGTPTNATPLEQPQWPWWRQNIMGSGYIDLAVLNCGSNNESILTNNADGSGAFTAMAQAISTEANATSLALFNTGNGEYDACDGDISVSVIEKVTSIEGGVRATVVTKNYDFEDPNIFLGNEAAFKKNPPQVIVVNTGAGYFVVRQVNNNYSRILDSFNSSFTCYFEPNPAVIKSKDNVFNQKVKQEDPEGMSLIKIPTETPRVTPSGYMVDVEPTFDFGFYGFGNNGLVRAGYGNPGDSTGNKPALLQDTPHSGQNELNCTYSFETWAVAKTGKDGGIILSGISWGLTVKNGIVTSSKIVPLFDPGQLQLAVQAWNQQALGITKPPNSPNQQPFGLLRYPWCLPSAEGSGNYISPIRAAFCHARYGCRSTFRRRKTVLASDGRGS